MQGLRLCISLYIFSLFFFHCTFFFDVSGAAISSAGSPGNVSVGSHTSEDLLLGSLQSTLDPNKCSWEPGSIPTSDQRRPSSKEPG